MTPLEIIFWSLITFMVFLIIAFLIGGHQSKKKEKKDDGEIKEGLVIRWKDQKGTFDFISAERNMVAGWGKVKVYDNGVVEFLPDSDTERLYRGEDIWDFNPYMSASWRRLNYIKEEDKLEVYWADGTDRFKSPRVFKMIMDGAEE